MVIELPELVVVVNFRPTMPVYKIIFKEIQAINKRKLKRQYSLFCIICSVVGVLIFSVLHALNEKLLDYHIESRLVRVTILLMSHCSHNQPIENIVSKTNNFTWKLIPFNENSGIFSCLSILLMKGCTFTIPIIVLLNKIKIFFRKINF